MGFMWSSCVNRTAMTTLYSQSCLVQSYSHAENLHTKHSNLKIKSIIQWPRKQSPNFRLIAVFVFAAIASSLSLPVPSPRRCLCLCHRLVAVFACTIVLSLSLPASSSSSRSPHRRLRLHLIAFTSSPSSPSPSLSPLFHCCLRIRRHLIAVFNFAIGSSPSSLLPISSFVAYKDGTIGSRKKLMVIEQPR
ncbi:Uncharacterized protein APZ42_034467 [Daphnia magna]|uniref:Uncharacterized protein n=1 Tax=Daphnia magna TaxID=35525 RepID=A0A164K7G4_9CRUS|nr:Uncharacterized protein APZ42_034467 [Daphnia magna]